MSNPSSSSTTQQSDDDMRQNHPEEADILPDAQNTSLVSLIEHSVNSVLRFQHEGAITCLSEGISGLSQAIVLIPPGDNRIPPLFHNLALAYFLRFGCLGNVADINHSIECWIRAVSLTPDQGLVKADRINNLANSYLQKSQRLGDLEALNYAISSFEEAVSLSSSAPATVLSGLLNNLGNVYSYRYEALRELSDIDQAITHQVHAVALLDEGNPARPGWLKNLGDSYCQSFAQSGKLEYIDKAIKHISESVSLTPENDNRRAGRLNSLGLSYQSRFEHLGRLPDIDEAISCLSWAISVVPADSNEKATFLNNLAAAYAFRHQLLEAEEDVRRGIACEEEATRYCPIHDITLAASIASNLGGFFQLRFHVSKDLADIDLMVEHTSRGISILPDGHPDKFRYLHNVAVAYRLRFDTSGDASDVQNSISYSLQAISLTPNSHPYKYQWVSNLGSTYYTLYEHSKENVEHLNLAIKYQFEGLKLCPEDHADRSVWLMELSKSVLDHYRLTKSRSSMELVLAILRHSAFEPTNPLHVRYMAAQQLGTFTSIQDPQQAIEGWKTAMDLLPDVVWLGHTVSRRYQVVSNIGYVVSSAVSAAISGQRYDTALEWFEIGHSVIWKQILQLRTPVEELRAFDPELASELERVSRDLEQAGALGLHVDPSELAANGIASTEKATQRHHLLAREWDTLVRRVREIPSFNNFLRPKRSDELIKAAHAGAIAIIHVGEETCGALIIKHNAAEVTYLALPQFSHKKATSAYNQVKHMTHNNNTRDSAQRKFTQNRAPSHEYLRLVLALLWHEVVKPVLDYLGYERSDSEDLPHITWCSTGLLSFLPLHAAGIYPSTEKVFNYAISSYTPTLSALLPVSTDPIRFTRLLAVSQPETLGQAYLPGTVEELRRVVQPFREEQVTCLNGSDATCTAVLSAVETHSWVHLACHASQNSTAPGTSAFYLHDGPLQLSTIMSKSLKHAEFAFLSACQTASGDESLPDEAVHLAAGMLMAGYSTVIATMWSIGDEDAPLVAEHVYVHMMRDGKPDSRRAARALHLAVKLLRDKIGEGSFASWVPYIHTGM